MNHYTKCAACPTMLRYDALQYRCDSCMCHVCPACAGTTDCDDPMPTVKECPDCLRVAA
jgi:hypothetical protein